MKSSYGLKHQCEEEFIGRYISNGELIAAAIAAGFKHKRIDGSLNCMFEKQKRKGQ
jgi:hypothetical protein